MVILFIWEDEKCVPFYHRKISIFCQYTRCLLFLRDRKRNRQNQNLASQRTVSIRLQPINERSSIFSTARTEEMPPSYPETLSDSQLVARVEQKI